jgi:hypothetical protein
LISVFWTFFVRFMSGSVLIHRQVSPEDFQELCAWYQTRDTLLGQNGCQQDIKKALKLASVCEHPNAVWLTKLFAVRDVVSYEEARQVFLGCETDLRALCFAGLLGETPDEIRRPADLGDAFAQALMAEEMIGEDSFRWAEKSAAQGERDGFYNLAQCYQHGIRCKEDAERAKENFCVAAELGHVGAMICVGLLLGEVDPQRSIWFGRATVSGYPISFLKETRNQVRSLSSRTGRASIVFAIGRALKGHINNEK